jgi:CheY-like chemotaxis protein
VREGFAVQTASDGDAGLRLAQALKPSAVLLDVMMPRMDGWAVLSALKSDPELADVPVIMVTMVQEKGLAFSLGAADYLSKPVQWTRLRDALSRVRSEAAAGTALVIEEDESTRRDLREALEQAGWDVTETGTGRAALLELATLRPGLIVADLQLPDVSGIWLLQEIRKTPGLGSVPVIAVSDREVTPAQRECLQGQVHQILHTGDSTSEEELVAELRRIAPGPQDQHRPEQR